MIASGLDQLISVDSKTDEIIVSEGAFTPDYYGTYLFELMVYFESCTDSNDKINVTMYIGCHPESLALTMVSTDGGNELSYSITDETHETAVFTYSHFNCDDPVFDLYDGTELLDFLSWTRTGD
jgi:hypothetical protein